MYPEDIDPPADSTCTTCQFSEDFSNYWTAVLYVLTNDPYHGSLS